MQIARSQSSPSRFGRWLGAAGLLGFLVLALLGEALLLRQASPPASTNASLEAGGLFNPATIWKLHLTFLPGQWTAMEPQGGSRGGPGGGGFGPPDREGEEGGSGRQGAGGFARGRGPGGSGGDLGPGGFGPSKVLAGLFLKQADADHNQKLARAEFTATWLGWFAAWDTNKTGELDTAKIQAGMQRLMSGAGRMRSGGPGPGGPPPGGGNRFDYVTADLDFGGWHLPNVSVRYKGNNTYTTSRDMLKRPLNLDLNRGFKGRRLGGVTSLNLHNNVNDAGAMNESLSYRLFRDAGVPSCGTTYARVYITVPGLYTNRFLGLYSVIENVDRNFTWRHYGTKRGALFKPTTRQLFEDLGDTWADYEGTYNAKGPILDEEARAVIEFSKLVSHASDAQFAARLEEFLNLDAFSRFMAVTVWLSNMDSLLSMGQNFHVYLHPKTRQFQFLPWDFDHSFGQFSMAGSADDLENLSILKPWSGQNRFLERVFQVEKFKQLYLARMQEFSRTILQPERICRQVDELAPILRPAIAEESEKLLARFEQVTAGNSTVPGGFGPPDRDGAGNGFPKRQDTGEPYRERQDGPGSSPGFGEAGPRPGGPPGGFGHGTKPIKSFVTVRAKAVQDQLSGISEGATLSRSGGGGPPGGGPSGGRDPGRGAMLGRAFARALDTNADSLVSRNEFAGGLSNWFDSWDTERTGALNEEQLHAGLNKVLSLSGGGPPPGMSFEPPPSSDQPEGPDIFE